MKWLFNKIKEITKKKESQNVFDKESHSIVITYHGTNKKIFNEVVKMFCDEFEKVNIKINNVDDFILESKLLKSLKIMKFKFPIPLDLPSDIKLMFDVIKKNVQLKVKGVKKYEGIDVKGVKKIFIKSSEIHNLFDIINNDKQFHDFNFDLFLNIQILFYTAIFDYPRFTNFAKELDKHLKLDKIDYLEVKKRIIDAVEEATGGLNDRLEKGDKINKKALKNIVSSMGQQGAVKLIYMRNFIWNVKDFKKNPKLLEKLSHLIEFMEETLNSEGFHKDFLIASFELSSDIDYVSIYGCYAMINDKNGLDESIFRTELPERFKIL